MATLPCSTNYSYLSFYSFNLDCEATNCPLSAPMHVGERPTWLNSVALSHDKDIFFEKKKIGLFNTVR